VTPGADGCAWCGRAFAARRGGREQRFCRPFCRRDFHEAARAWALSELAAGRLSVHSITNAGPATCALPKRAEGPPPLPDIGRADPALLAALRIRGQMILRLPIAPEAIADLVALDWLDRRNCGYPASVADAVVNLATEALDARLRPR
jgi:hypothetical protein